ncbi:hypothetical protein Tco_0629855 [Tanacetum coccineum]|uniref:Tf2-1-like SH3-like domain-containing protein n=1 Tax=Tanacetum coccineum TaxID=301880 RepID=A0ABQ4WUK8_9ASTR
MFMTIHSNVKDKILATTSETSKVENAPAEMLRDLDQQMEKRADDGKLKAARDRQKSYADNRRQPLEFEVGDRVMLKVSPCKGVIRFGKKGKLAPRYVGPFEILERISPVAYQLRLHEELKPVENSDREVKRLKCSRIVVVKAKLLAVRYLVKVSWNSKGNFELTWVWEDYLKDKYPRLIVWLVKPLVLTYESVVMYGLCVYMRYVDCVRVGNQSIERDRLIGIGLVMDLVKFLSFTFGGKEMTFVIYASVCGSCKASGEHGLYVTIVCYVLLAIVVDRGTRSVPLFVVLERDRLKALVDLSVTVSLLWIVDSERDRLIVVRFVSMFVTIERERLNVD